MQRVDKIVVSGDLGQVEFDLPADADIFKIVGSGTDIVAWYTTDPTGAVEDVETELRLRRFHVATEGEILPSEEYVGQRKLYIDSVLIAVSTGDTTTPTQAIVRHVWEIEPPAIQQDLQREIRDLRAQYNDLITIVRGGTEIRNDIITRLIALEDYTEINVETD